MPATTPTPGEALPAPLARLVGDEPHEAVWRNDAGGWTLRLPRVGHHLKWTPADAPVWVPDPEEEAARLAWARRWTVVPEVLEVGGDDDGRWLRTVTLPGRSAVDARWLDDPATAVAAIGAGLRRLHDALPAADCPFDWSPQQRLAHLQPGHEHERDELALPPPVDRLVVCHGDACAPNTLVGDDGRPVGHVDLGTLGLADRWADLAVATLSLGWNYGPGWEGALLDAYGVEADPERTAWYQRLWDAT